MKYKKTYKKLHQRQKHYSGQWSEDGQTFYWSGYGWRIKRVGNKLVTYAVKIKD